MARWGRSGLLSPHCWPEETEHTARAEKDNNSNKKNLYSIHCGKLYPFPDLLPTQLLLVQLGRTRKTWSLARQMTNCSLWELYVRLTAAFHFHHAKTHWNPILVWPSHQSHFKNRIHCWMIYINSVSQLSHRWDPCIRREDNNHSPFVLLAVTRHTNDVHYKTIQNSFLTNKMIHNFLTALLSVFKVPLPTDLWKFSNRRYAQIIPGHTARVKMKTVFI